MVTAKRGWHNPRKEIPKSIECRCPFCHKRFKNIGKHIHDMHKGEKGWEEEMKRLGLSVKKKLNK